MAKAMSNGQGRAPSDNILFFVRSILMQTGKSHYEDRFSLIGCVVFIVLDN